MQDIEVAFEGRPISQNVNLQVAYFAYTTRLPLLFGNLYILSLHSGILGFDASA